MNMDFLKYDASSIRALLRKKLLESGLYTDQIYPGSDISILIDLMSWMFDVLTYMLNANASDVLFADSNIYENMNKLVKLLSYSPKAYITSNAVFTIELNDNARFANQTVACRIPKFASIATGKADSNGREIRYSFIEDYAFSIINGVVQLPKYKPVLYNGTFKHYVFELRASGEKFCKLTMLDVGPADSLGTLIDNDTVHVYVENVDENGNKVYREVSIVKSLVMDAASTDLACEVRLNEKKEFEVKFGDGIHGQIPEYGTIVHMVYLVSNGPDGVIDSGEVSTTAIEIKIDGFSSKTDLVNMLYDGSDSFILNYVVPFTNNYLPIFKTSAFRMSNIEKSSDPLDYESVNDMREYAPDNFRLGNRLVTASDYRTFILNSFPNRFKNVSVMNNAEYCSLFYKWLDKYDKLDINIRLNSYPYASACDFNNVYVFLEPLKQNVIGSDRDAIIRSCANRKTLTTDVVPCDGVHTYFMPFVNSENFTDRSNIFTQSFTMPSHIIIKTSPTYLSKSTIKKNVASIIIDYFKKNASFGSTINFAEIQQKIFALGYVEGIKTVSVIPDDIVNGYYSKYVEGLSFAAFTPDLILMNDFTVATQHYSLSKFQYGTLFKEELLIDCIEVSNEDSLKTLRDTEF